MSAGVDREPPEPPNTSRTSPRTPRTGGIHKGLNHARIVSKHGSLNRRLPPHARRKQEARSLNVKVKQEVRRAGPHFFKAAAEHYEPRITAAADSRGCCAAPCTAHGSKHTSGDQCMPLMHRRGPRDHGIDELAFALSKVAAEHYGQARSHRTGWLTGVVLYSARHCVWLNRPSRGSLHDLYEASLAIVSIFWTLVSGDVLLCSTTEHVWWRFSLFNSAISKHNFVATWLRFSGSAVFCTSV
ncbi:uncharacterized protein ISCGN_009923 [Ixodes scapularis]